MVSLLEWLLLLVLLLRWLIEYWLTSSVVATHLIEVCCIGLVACCRISAETAIVTYGFMNLTVSVAVPTIAIVVVIGLTRSATIVKTALATASSVIETTTTAIILALVIVRITKIVETAVAFIVVVVIIKDRTGLEKLCE